MKIYLASRFGRREQMKAVAKQLEASGHTICTRWLDTEWCNRPDESSAAPPEYRAQYAQIDLEDVKNSDCVISFTEAPNSTAGKRGGRHVEFGYGLALHKVMIVVGYRENLFHEHPSIIYCQSVYELFDKIKECDRLSKVTNRENSTDTSNWR